MDLPIALNVIPFLVSKNSKFRELLNGNKEQEESSIKQEESSTKQEEFSIKQEEFSIKQEEFSIKQEESSIKQEEFSTKEGYNRDLFYSGFTFGACITVSAVVILIYVIPVSWIHRIARWKNSQ